MAPNLLKKTGFVRGDYVSEEAVTKCRTDFILQNVYSIFIREDLDFQPLPAENSKEERTLKVYKAIIEDFRDSYTTTIKGMVKRMKISSVDLLPELQSVSAELFSEGVTWGRVIGFFVFVGELASQHASNDKSGNTTNKLYESFCRHVKETMMSWVEDNGGWEGVECLAVKKDSAPKIDTTTSSDLNTTKSSDQVWYKNVATGAVRIVGTLFQLASPHVQSYT